jgi:hypothetical protein
MVDNNHDAKISWLYESDNGTPLITTAATQTYLFGNYNDNRQQFANVSQNTKDIYTNDKRSVSLVKDATQFNTWKHDVIPTNCIPEFLFLGQSTAGTPNKLDIKNTGKKHSFTTRIDITGGTNTRLNQVCGNQTVDYSLTANMDSPNIVSMSNVWTKMETHDDRDILTSTPAFPNSIDTSFAGLEEVKWDYGEVGVSDWDEAFEFEISQKQNFQTVKKSASEQEVLIGTYSPVNVKVAVFINQNTQYDAYVDKSVVDVSFKCYKPNDRTKYKQIVLKNFQIENIVDTYIMHEGYKASLITAKAESFEVYFLDGLTFATFYPAYA